ncbi:MAG: helix-turn-helix domain-containing protein [Intrasporangium sp.]|uniref:ArsR/SmtB family transcription factor n=1 Tax=Intrasporangium sp. TaxID=1925024 RepID=UPI0026479A4A|nr:helix-turn-helix domain-containing protein [Intrasporangium sp.]MDN5796490.1 helix-turn-helix domain-containing protein [Intrasporangium sp.]
MGTWLLTADVLARSRFTVSPLHETVAAMFSLNEPSGPWEQAFSARHFAAYEEMLAKHPVRQVLATRSMRPRRGDQPGWVADYLGPAPTAAGLDLETQLGDLAREWDDDRIRAALLEVRPGPLPTVMQGGGLTEELVALMRWVWSALIEADWPRRRRVLEADIVSRTSRLATHGWAGVIPTLGAKREWLGGGRFQINRYDLPERDITAAQLLVFIPVHGAGSWASWEEPDRYAVVYPVTGTLAQTSGPSRDVLGRLMGRGRAAVLSLLDVPRSPSQLAALTGLPIGAVGNHLKILLGAGLVLRRRSGREVLYWRTDLADGLVAAAGSPEPAGRPQ